MDFFDLLQNHAAVFLLLLARMSGLFLIGPFWGSQNFPTYFRVGLALLITVLLFPTIDSKMHIEAPATILGYGLAIIAETFIGWLIGFIAFTVLSAVNMAGKIMDMQAGFAVVNEMDPTSNQQNPLIGSFLYYLTLIIFVVVNGHHRMLIALVNSIEAIPPLGMHFNPNIATLIIDFVGGVFSTGMQIAMPLTFAILLTNVALGVLARTMPQMNIFVVGIPMHIVIGIFSVAVVMPFYVMFLDVLFNELYGDISVALRALQ